MKKLVILFIFVSMFMAEGAMKKLQVRDIRSFNDVNKYIEYLNEWLAQLVNLNNQVIDATYITQVPHADLTNEQALSILGQGLLKATANGVVSLAVAGTDYEVPLTFNNGVGRTGNNVSVVPSEINHTGLSGIGSYSHSDIDGFIAETTSTPTANKIPVADTAGLLSEWVVVDTIPLEPTSNGVDKSFAMDDNYLYARVDTVWQRIAWDMSWAVGILPYWIDDDNRYIIDDNNRYIIFDH